MVTSRIVSVQSNGTAQEVRHKGAATGQRWGFLEWFLISQVVLPMLLYLPGTQSVRVPIRVSAYAGSLAALAWWFVRDSRSISAHPACRWLALVVAYLTLMILHPTTNSLLAGLAQVMLYTSVLAPLFWVPRMIRGPQQLSTLVMILLVINGINSVVGVLQVYDPDRFMPQELSAIVTDAHQDRINGLRFDRGDGTKVFRPMGLSDNPGGVCVPASAAAVLGLTLCASRVELWKKVCGLIFGSVSVVAIFLSHVRTMLVIVLFCMAVFFIVQIWLNQLSRAIRFLCMIGALSIILFAAALSLGGEATKERFATLIEDNPTEVYYKAQRGNQLEYALTSLLFDYPLGAGLGRWGMMRFYFGDLNNTDSPAIWAELQFSAWILDGGVVLLVLYLLALLVNSVHEFQLMTSAVSSSFSSWIVIIFTLNAGATFLIFGSTLFTTQVGLQYWFMAGALHGAVTASQESLRCPGKRSYSVAG
ncbi:MAG TPA: hypothetical protein VH592_12605 [Gemmataceae bacterium]